MQPPTQFTIYRPRLAPPARPASVTPVEDWRSGVIVRAVNWLGDTMMCIPAVYRLRTVLPSGCQLAVVCPKPLAPLWQAAEWVDSVFPMNGKRVGGACAQAVRTFNAGASVILPNSFGSALDMAWKGIPVRIGRAGRGRRFLLTGCLPKWQPDERRADCHQLSNYLDIVSALGPLERTPECPPLDLAQAPDMTGKLGIQIDEANRWLAIAPGAAYGPAKQWPVDNFRQVADAWTAEGGRVVVVGTNAERDAAVEIIDPRSNNLNLCGKTSLSQLMAVLKTVALCVANDSGAMHLAAGLGTPGVAIFGSTNPDATGPLGAPWVVLANPPACAPCFARECQRPANRYQCLTAITPDHVMQALTFLEKRRHVA